MTEVRRNAGPLVKELLLGFRGVVVNGPRQSGKSTLVGQVQAGRGPLVTLDDPLQLDLARADPTGFLAALPPKAAIDEFQRGGSPLLLAAKRLLDETQDRGRLLLAGSTRFLTTRRLAETLTGRVGIVDLLPLSAGEVRGTHERFVDEAFRGVGLLDAACETMDRTGYAELVAAGGFPELVLGPPARRFRSAWCRSYLDTVLAPANIEQVAEIRRPDIPALLLARLAARSSTEIVVADLAREVGADDGTIRSNLQTLETLYLVRSLPAWTTSRTNRAKRRAVAHLVDTALACQILGETADSLGDPVSRNFGPLLESYVVAEIAKQLTWCEKQTSMLHYRDRDQREVDIILERHNRIVAIEVKATSTPLTRHARHISYLAERLGERFSVGIVLHTGSQRARLADRIVALPISSLWAGR